MRATETAREKGVEVYDVDSGIGGHFTVSIIQDMENGVVVVRIWQGEFTVSGWKSYGIFDGKTFQIHRSKLFNHREIC
ncbi:hypothetical protein [Rhizobium sp. YS-1r]|uniref:hypothetical protein n=1 Tax=Rhizobium sp. YS-1r TaxID=1532558 RepID=UPI00050F7313|nr:hypothetical protein [Rhizobium sp. YS-1r]KGD87657.1 hypothetical protein JL39_25795 [Rhizobium sp. YS-1r]